MELLTPETMKLVGSTENKTAKDKNGENVSHLEITEVVIVHINIINNDYQQDSGVLYTFAPKHMAQKFDTLKYGLQIKMDSH